MKTRLFYGIIFCAITIASAQPPASLLLNDTNSVKLIINNAKELRSSNPDSALILSTQCSEAAERSGNYKLASEAQLIAGGIYLSKGNAAASGKLAGTSVILSRKCGDSAGVAAALNLTGRTKLFLGKFPEALTAFISALKLYEKAGDIKNAGYSNLNIGKVFLREKNYDKALACYRIAMKQFEQTGESRGRHLAYSSLGYIYEQQSDYNNALAFNFKCLNLYTHDGDKAGIAGICTNIGFLKAADGSLEEGLDYAQRAVLLYKELGNKEALPQALNNLGIILLQKSDLAGAEKTFQEALAGARATGNKEETKNALQNLSELSGKKGDFQKAFLYHKEFSAIKDSIYSKENQKIITEIQARYETEKKEQEIMLLQKEAELDKEKIAKKNTLIGFIAVGLLLLVLSLALLMNRYQLKNRTNAELTKQNLIIERKNKDITDSISYAKRIQEAFLPSVKEIEKRFSDSFILYIPKDIVSGDFYWFYSTGNKLFFAVADCTGHGVPGALMSMIGHDELNHIVIEKAIHSPGQILSMLNRNVKQSLKQEEQEGATRDGMDIALICLEYQKDGKAATLTYAGAQRPAILLNANGLTELKADKCSIAGFTHSTFAFNEQEFTVETGSAFYLFSDGYSDQFGGDNGKKFKYRRLLQLLSEHYHLGMKEQQEILRKTFADWRGTLEQLDDICVAGFRV